MYTREETILLKIFLKRLIHKRFDFSYMYLSKTFFTPIMVGCENVRYYHDKYPIRIAILFPYNHYFNQTCREEINSIVKGLGLVYGLQIKCMVFPTNEFNREGQIQRFNLNHTNVFTNSPEIVK